MSKTSDRIEEILSHMILWDGSKKDQIRAADENTKKEILPLLEEADAENTKFFRRMVEKDPAFFQKLEDAMLKHQDEQKA